MADDAPEWYSLPQSAGAELAHLRHVPAMTRPHRHFELELNLVTGGRAAYVVGDVRIEMLPGRLLWLAPGQGHILVDASPDFAFWLGVFDEKLVDEAYEGTSEAMALKRGDAPGFLYRGLVAPERLERAFESVAFSGPLSRTPGFRWALLLAWEAYEAAHDEPARALHPSVARAAALLQTGGREWTLDSLAVEVGLSATYLSALFRSQIGVGIADFRNQTRLARYQALIARGGMGIEDAARRAGFGSYAQFYRVVRAATGSSPSFRASNKTLVSL